MRINSQIVQEMDEIIKRSHQRSLQYNIDPLIAKAPEENKLTDEELQKRIKEADAFFSIAKEHIDNLYELLQGSGFCLNFTNAEGYILYVVGDKELEDYFIKRNCMPGYRWTEEDLGTCAIGLTIAEQCPIFLPGQSMYSVHARNVTNAASPIFGIDNEFLGVICISGYSDRVHIHTLGLVCQAAEAIKLHLKEQRNSIELAIQNEYMQALLEAGTRGVVTVDQFGAIVKTNKKACALLELPENHIGKLFLNFATTDFDLLDELTLQKGFLLRELRCKRKKYFLSLAPVILQTGEAMGAVLIITQKNEMIELAMEIAGAEAIFTFDSIIGTSKPLLNAVEMAKIAAQNDAPVLLLGETGTGKELFAQAIHNASQRKDKPFIALNCGAIPKELLESELFGYEEGSFTSAQKGGRAGKIEIADKGTLFLDEIGDMPFDMQVKLLRVLQTGEIRRVGSVRTIKVDIRVISATNKNLQEEIEAEHFRADLFYRISTLDLTVPPLREREGDLLLLVDFFMKRHGYLSIEKSLAPQTKELLQNYSWPGNVRQLENTVERAIYLAQGDIIKPEHFMLVESPKIQLMQEKYLTLESMEKDAIEKRLSAYSGNLSQCAKSLGISRPTLYRKMDNYKIY